MSTLRIVIIFKLLGLRIFKTSIMRIQDKTHNATPPNWNTALSEGIQGGLWLDSHGNSGHYITNPNNALSFSGNPSKMYHKFASSLIPKKKQVAFHDPCEMMWTLSWPLTIFRNLQGIRTMQGTLMLLSAAAAVKLAARPTTLQQLTAAWRAPKIHGPKGKKVGLLCNINNWAIFGYSNSLDFGGFKKLGWLKQTQTAINPQLAGSPRELFSVQHFVLRKSSVPIEGGSLEKILGYRMEVWKKFIGASSDTILVLTGPYGKSAAGKTS